jgi:hypothetical protein
MTTKKPLFRLFSQKVIASQHGRNVKLTPEQSRARKETAKRYFKR